MAVIKSLWASVQGDPIFMRRVNGWLTVFWIVMIPVSVATHWVNSVTYVAALSLWALVSANSGIAKVIGALDEGKEHHAEASGLRTTRGAPDGV